jgi:hypothetical protein
MLSHKYKDRSDNRQLLWVQRQQQIGEQERW